MTRKKRRILFYSVALIFLFTAPILTAYTSGYRVDWKNRSFIRLGSIIIETSPAEAIVSLDGKPLIDTTPLRVSNLHPQTYTVKLEKEGYYSWEKTISVEEGKTNLLVNIPLFQKEKPQLIFKGNIHDVNISPSFLFRSFLVVLEETENSYEIILSDFAGEKKKTLFRQSKKNDPPKLHGFSSNHQFLLVSSQTGWFLIQTETDELIELFSEKNPLILQTIHWDNEKRNIIRVDTNGVSRFDPDTRATEILLEKKNVLDFQIFQTGTWSLQKDSEGKIAFWKDMVPLFPISEQAQNLSWKNDHTVVYTSSNEIFSFDTREKKKNLITRGSESIQKMLPLREVNYVLLSQDNSLTLLELIGEEPSIRISLELDNIQEMHTFDVAEDGKNVFIAASNGLFLKTIQ